MSLFSRKVRGYNSNDPVNNMVEVVKSTVDPMTVSSTQTAKAAMSMESISDADRNMLASGVQRLNTALESVVSTLNMSANMTTAQKDAAVAAGIISGDVRTFMKHSVTPPTISMEGAQVVNMTSMTDGGTAQRAFSMEAYDESENRNAMTYSIVYNMQAARQDDFCEAFFPTVVVSPDNIGIEFVVRIMRVHNDKQRNISGALTDFGFKNILRAVADPTILKNELTRAIPVNRPESAANFVDAADIASYDINVDDYIIHTAPLAVGKTIDLIGISQTDTLLDQGVMDASDSLDPSASIVNLYAKLGSDIVSFDVSMLPMCNFTYSVQDNYRKMNLAFTTTSILMNKNSKRVDNSALVDLADIATGDYIVRLKVVVTGDLNLQTGQMTVYGNKISVSSISNATGVLIDKADPAVAGFVNVIDSGALIGYDIKAYRANSNRRQRGQLIDTTEQRYTYSPVLLSPITALHPVNHNGDTDSSDLATLITATRIRTSNMGVGALIRAANILSSYVDSRDTSGEAPEIFGVGRFYVLPTYFKESIDMALAVDSLKSHERAEDIQAVLINKIRDVAYRMYRDSQYKAAADALHGGEAPIPTVIIGTDPVIARYLMVTGDLRTLSNNFNVKIVSSLDRRVTGKIFLTFGNFNGDVNAAPNPLHFGVMAWKPELTLVMPISRNGQVSKELSVQPNFIHLVNMPILSVIDVVNIPDVVASKVAVNTHTL